MSIPDTNGTTGKAGVKTLAIRLEPELHAQLSLIAQLRGATITDEIKAALEAHITAAKSLPELAGRAEAVLDDIERDATARRNAIATLFGTTEPEPADAAADAEQSAPAATSGSRPRGRRSGSEDAGT